MSPVLIVIVIVLVAVFGMAIRHDLRRRRLRNLPGATRSRLETKQDAQGRIDRQQPGGSDPGGGFGF